MRKFLITSCYLTHAAHCYDFAQNSEDYYTTIGVNPCMAVHPFKFKKNGVEVGSNSLNEYFNYIREIINQSI